MSELNLEHSGQFEVNAKNPTAVDAIQTASFNLKPSTRYLNASELMVIGYEANDEGIDLGRASSGITEGVNGLTGLLVSSNDHVTCRFGGNKWSAWDNLDVEIEGVTYSLVWDGGSLLYAVITVGAYAQLTSLIGATCKIVFSEGTP